MTIELAQESAKSLNPTRPAAPWQGPKVEFAESRVELPSLG